MDNQILSLYAKGMSNRDIVATFDEMYGADISPSLVSQVTNSVMERVTEWQNSPLDAVYPIVYLVPKHINSDILVFHKLGLI